MTKEARNPTDEHCSPPPDGPLFPSSLDIPSEFGTRHSASPGPDWGAISYEVSCPLCDYNLRGLIEPRCPECGYRFEWPEVLDPNRQPHPYLFEHHPERSLWSYRKTVNGAGRPKRFWTSLHPTQPSRPWRLFVYSATGLWLLVMAGLCFACMPAIRDIQQTEASRKQLIRSVLAHPDFYNLGTARSIEDYARQQIPPLTLQYALARNFANGEMYREFMRAATPLLILMPAFWLLLSIGALMIFQISLRRGRLKNIHLVRVAVYTADPGSWAGVLLLLWMCQALMGFLGSDTEWIQRPWGIMQTLGLCAVWTTWRLRQACRYYLRFTWPTATAILTQLIVLLTVLLIPLIWDTHLAIELMRAYGLWHHTSYW